MRRARPGWLLRTDFLAASADRSSCGPVQAAREASPAAALPAATTCRNAVTARRPVCGGVDGLKRGGDIACRRGLLLDGGRRRLVHSPNSAARTAVMNDGRASRIARRATSRTTQKAASLHTRRNANRPHPAPAAAQSLLKDVDQRSEFAASYPALSVRLSG